MKAQEKTQFQIVPIKHDTLGIVYHLKEGTVLHGKFGSVKSAERSKLEITKMRDTLKAIRDTRDVEFSVKL